MPGRGQYWKVGGINDEHIKEEDLTQALQNKLNSGVSNKTVHVMGTSSQIQLTAGIDNIMAWNANGFNTNIGRVQIPVADDFVFSRLTIHLFANTSNGQSKFVLMKNGAVANSEVIIPTGTAGTFQDLVNTDSLVSGDLIAIKYLADQATTGQYEPKGYSYVSES